MYDGSAVSFQTLKSSFESNATEHLSFEKLRCSVALLVGYMLRGCKSANSEELSKFARTGEQALRDTSSPCSAR